MAEETNCVDNCETTGSGITGPESSEAYCFLSHTLTVKSDGTVSLTPRTPPDDGTYNRLEVTDGCLSALTFQEPRGYVADPCCPGDGDTPPGGVTISNAPYNILTENGGLYARTYIQAGSGVTITGFGNAAQPYIVSASSAGGVAQSFSYDIGNPVELSGAGTGTNPYKYTHKVQAHGGLNVRGITVDEWGHVTDIDADESVDLSSPNGTIDITPGGDIDQEQIGSASAFNLAGLTLEVDEYGRASTTGTFAGLTTTVDYMKADTTTGTLTFTDGILTGVT